MDISDSPLSPILFLFYIAPLLEELESRGISTCGFVDDTGILATGKSTKSNCDELTDIHDNICMSWARKQDNRRPQ